MKFCRGGGVPERQQRKEDQCFCSKHLSFGEENGAWQLSLLLLSILWLLILGSLIWAGLWPSDLLLAEAEPRNTMMDTIRRQEPTRLFLSVSSVPYLRTPKSIHQYCATKSPANTWKGFGVCIFSPFLKTQQFGHTTCLFFGLLRHLVSQSWSTFTLLPLWYLHSSPLYQQWPHLIIPKRGRFTSHHEPVDQSHAKPRLIVDMSAFDSHREGAVFTRRGGGGAGLWSGLQATCELAPSSGWWSEATVDYMQRVCKQWFPTTMFELFWVLGGSRIPLIPLKAKSIAPFGIGCNLFAYVWKLPTYSGAF